MVQCQISGGNRVYERYARHLQMHAKKGKLSKEKMGVIIFQPKTTGKDAIQKFNHSQIGVICSI